MILIYNFAIKELNILSHISHSFLQYVKPFLLLMQRLPHFLTNFYIWEVGF